MSETTGGDFASVTNDGFSVSSNTESADEIRDNFGSEPKPLDGEAPDPEKEQKERVSKAASELGKKGGAAAAEKRAAETKAGEEPAEGKAEEARPDKKKGDPRFDPSARVREATSQLAEERAERRRLEERLARIEAAQREIPASRETAPEEPRRAQAAPAPDADGKPQVGDFEHYEDFVEALTDWKADKREKQAEQRRSFQAETQTLEQRMGVFAKAMTEHPEAASIDPKLFEIKPTFALQPGENAGPHNDVAAFAINSDHAPEIFLHFTRHPEDFRAMMALPNRQAVTLAMARLEGRLEAGKSAEPERKPGPVAVSKAKPPVKPVTSTAQSGGDDVDDETPVEEHFRKMNARDRGAQRGRF